MWYQSIGLGFPFLIFYFPLSIYSSCLYPPVLKNPKQQDERRIVDHNQNQVFSSSSKTNRVKVYLHPVKQICLLLPNSLSFWDVLASQTLRQYKSHARFQVRSPGRALFPQVSWAGSYHVGRHVWVANSKEVPFEGGVKQICLLLHNSLVGL